LQPIINELQVNFTGLTIAGLPNRPPFHRGCREARSTGKSNRTAALWWCATL